MSSNTNNTQFQGAYTALITPFRDDRLDEVALRRIVDFQISEGISGLVPSGTTGEAVTLSTVEHQRVIELVADHSGDRVPVIAGTGSNDTRTTIERTRHAQLAGAAAALVVVPYYNKPSQAGMIRHFSLVAEATDLPIILYNVPGRTGVNMMPETVLHLAEVPTIVGIKEASGSLDQVTEIVVNAPAGFSVLSGDDSLTLPIMSVGGNGVISVTSNIAPRAVSDLTAAAIDGNWSDARHVHGRLFELSRAMFLENNPTAVKTAAAHLGFCTSEVRSPLTQLSDSNRERLTDAMASFGFSSVASLAAD